MEREKEHIIKHSAIYTTLATAALSFFLVFVFAVFLNVKSARACGTYKINGSTTEIIYKSVLPNAIISFSLWYDTCTSSNFTSSNVIQGVEPVGSYFACVHRNSGPDGGDLEKCNANCPSTGVCNSPEVKSPNNTSYSRVFDTNFDSSSSSF